MPRPTTTVVRVLATVAVAVVAWLFVVPTHFGGSMTYIVVSGPSMEPVYETGDLVVAREQDEYAVGDIVVFSTEHGKVIHRIVGGDGESGYVMQGDNNPDTDAWSPTTDEVLGRAVVEVPGVGSAVLTLREVLITPPFPYLLAGFVFLVIVLGDDSKKRKPKSAQASDETAEPDSADASDEKVAV